MGRYALVCDNQRYNLVCSSDALQSIRNVGITWRAKICYTGSISPSHLLRTSHMTAAAFLVVLRLCFTTQLQAKIFLSWHTGKRPLFMTFFETLDFMSAHAMHCCVALRVAKRSWMPCPRMWQMLIWPIGLNRHTTLVTSWKQNRKFSMSRLLQQHTLLHALSVIEVPKGVGGGFRDPTTAWQGKDKVRTQMSGAWLLYCTLYRIQKFRDSLSDNVTIHRVASSRDRDDAPRRCGVCWSVAATAKALVSSSHWISWSGPTWGHSTATGEACGSAQTSTRCGGGGYYLLADGIWWWWLFYLLLLFTRGCWGGGRSCDVGERVQPCCSV